MERHAIDGESAFVILRESSQQYGRKLVEVAEAIVETRLSLPSALEVARARETDGAKSSSETE
jgi:hypothetical protein